MKKLPVALSIAGLLAAGAVAWYVQRLPSPGAQGLSALLPGAGTQADGAPKGGAGGAGDAGTGSSAGAPGGGAPGDSGKGEAGARPGGAGPGGPGGPVPVEIGKATATRLEDDTLAVGSLRARRGVVLRPEVNGRISALNFADGARVSSGQLLLQLDDTLQQAQLKQAEAQAAIARTNLQRSRELAQQNFVSQSAVDQNAAALDVAMSQVALAHAQLQRMRVLAPFDAVTGIRTANVGDYLKDGADVVTLDDVGTVYLDFKLPERYVPQIRKGGTIEALIDALPGRKFSGVVTALDSQIDTNGRALLVRAELRNNDGALRPGMFARARVVFGVRERAVLVPEEAVTPLAGKQFVFKAVQGPNGLVSQRLEAKLGARIPGKVEILEGLSDGDAVVTAGQARLARGDSLPLRVIDLDKPSGPRSGAGAGGTGKGAGSAKGPPPGSPGAASGVSPAAGPSASRPARP